MFPTPPVVTTPHQGVLFETPARTFFAVRDGFHYKFWVYILVSRTGGPTSPFQNLSF